MTKPILTALFFISCLSNFTIGQCMSGVYTIGSNASDNFTTIELAISNLSTVGMCGPVDFEIRTGTYTTSLIIPSIPGNSAANKLTIKSMSGIASNVVLNKYGATSLTNYTVKLNGIKYIDFKNISITRSYNDQYVNPVRISDTIKKILFSNVIFSTPYNLVNASNGTSSLLSIASPIDTFEVENCTFNSGCSNIYCMSPVNYYSVKNSIFNNWKGYSIANISPTQKVIISGNTIRHEQSTSGYTALYLYQFAGTVEIDHNKISHSASGPSSYYYPIRFLDISGRPDSITKVTITNNYIPNYATYVNTIYLSSIDSSFIINNTIMSCYDNLEVTSCSYIENINNIYHNKFYNKKLFNISNLSSFNSNNNCYYATTANSGLFTINSQVFSNFSTYRAQTGYDQNSMYHLPYYESSSSSIVILNNPHTFDIELDGVGQNTPYVTDDIDYQLRQTPPDIGCDEFNSPPNDASIISFNNYNGLPCPGVSSLSCQIRNTGTNQIDSLVFKVTVNNVIYGFFDWHGIIPSKDTVLLDVTTFDFQDLQSYTIKMEVVSVNDVSDTITMNNLLSKNFVTRMGGLYTIGTQTDDFSSLQTAIDELIVRKTCSTVTIEFADGTYDFLNSYAASDNNPNNLFNISNLNEDSIIFKPKYLPVNGNYRASIRTTPFVFYNCSNIYFNDLRFFHTPDLNSILFNYCDSIGFTNCYFDSTETIYNQYTSYRSAICFKNGTRIDIINSKFNAGKTAIDISSCTDINITHCLFKNCVTGLRGSGLNNFSLNNSVFLNNLVRDASVDISSSLNFNIESNKFTNKGKSALNITSNQSGFTNQYSRKIFNNQFCVDNADVIQMQFSDDIHFYHNSVIGINSNNSSTNSLFKFTDTNIDAGFHVTIEKNIVVNKNNAPIYEGYIPLNSNINYNAYDLANTIINSSSPSFVSWQALGYDTNGIYTTVNFTNNYDLHIESNQEIYKIDALSSSLVSFDLDGRVRDTIPSIGAFELINDTIDLKLLSQGLPSSICGGDDKPFQLFFTNLGPDTLFNADLFGVFTTTDTLHLLWEGKLGQGDTAFVDFGFMANQLSFNNPTFYFTPSPFQIDSDSLNNKLIHNYSTIGMAGDYIIGGENFDFFQLHDALDALNVRGLCDTVRLLLHHTVNPGSTDPNTYIDAGTIELEMFNGLENNMLIIDALDSTITLPYICRPIHITASNIKIRNINFYDTIFANMSTTGFNGSNGYYFYGNYLMDPFIYINSGSNLTIEKCRIRKQYDGGDLDEAIVFNNGNYSDITVSDNEFVLTQSCFYAHDNASFQNVIIKNNIRNSIAPYVDYISTSSQPSSSVIPFIRLSNAQNVLIEGNKGPCYAWLENISNGLTIRNNDFTDGLSIRYSTGTLNDPIKIYNNFFYINNSYSYPVPLSIGNSTFCDIFHNTIKGTANSGFSPQTSWVYYPVQFGLNQNIRLEKNLFLGSYAYWVLNPLYDSGITYSDHNIFKYQNNNFGNFEQNSLLMDIQTVSEFDLHLSPSNILPTIPSNTVLFTTNDIDYDVRNTNFPMYGADENKHFNLDMAVSDFTTSNSLCNDSVYLFANVSNEGLSTIYSTILEVSFGSENLVVNFNDSIQSFHSDTIYLGSFEAILDSVYVITINIQNVNGGSDSILLNNYFTTSYTHINQYYDHDIHLCEDDSILINNQYIHQNGYYFDTLTSSNNCDSIVLYQVIMHVDFLDTITIQTCKGDTILFDNVPVFQTGMYTQSNESMYSCDSIIVLNLTVNQTAPALFKSLSICEGDTSALVGLTPFDEDFYIDTIPYLTTCDSVFIYSINILPVNYNFDTLIICQGDSILINNQYENSAGTYYAYFPNQNGCNEVTETLLTIIDCENGISEVDFLQVRISPNPTTDKIQIIGINKPFSFVVRDLMGKIIIDQEKYQNDTIDFSKFERGCYNLTIEINGRILSFKIIVM
jgi:hypothetical protein